VRGENLGLAHRAACDVLDRVEKRQDTFTCDQVLGLLRYINSLFLRVVSDAGMRRRFALGLRAQIPIDWRSQIPAIDVSVVSAQPVGEEQDEVLL
jgi:hypothetical protein